MVRGTQSGGLLKRSSERGESCFHFCFAWKRLRNCCFNKFMRGLSYFFLNQAFIARNNQLIPPKFFSLFFTLERWSNGIISVLVNGKHPWLTDCDPNNLYNFLTKLQLFFYMVCKAFQLILKRAIRSLLVNYLH